MNPSDGPGGRPWARSTPEGWELILRVQPGSGRSSVVGVHDGALKVRVAAPANEGKANAELVRYLAKLLGVPKASVRLVRGERSRTKTVEVRGDIGPLEELVH